MGDNSSGIAGNEGNDIINAGDNVRTINGNDGNDRLNTGDGASAVYGGTAMMSLLFAMTVIMCVATQVTIS